MAKKRVSKLKSNKDSRATTEMALTADLNEDLIEAWEKIRGYSQRLGEQKIYASGHAIMFAKKTCFFFVRPRKSFLEVVIFLPVADKLTGFKSVKPVSKTRSAHTFKLVHADQVEGALTDAIERAFESVLPA